jgi:hypothetical protein
MMDGKYTCHVSFHHLAPVPQPPCLYCVQSHLPGIYSFFEADSILNSRGEKVELMDNFRSIQGNQDVSQQAVGLLLATMHSILQHL